MQHTVIAVDLAKNIFEVAISRRPGLVAKCHRLSRHRFLPFFAELKPTTVLLEACGSAHHWARQLQELGHVARHANLGLRRHPDLRTPS